MAAPEYDCICPVCGALPKQPCKTLTTGKTTDTHMARTAESQ